MKRSSLVAVACLTALMTYPAALGQDTTSLREANPRNRVIRLFDQNAPRVGDPLPPLSAYDSQGHPFDLKALQGKHTVLVFGCLT